MLYIPLFPVGWSAVEWRPFVPSRTPLDLGSVLILGHDESLAQLYSKIEGNVTKIIYILIKHAYIHTNLCEKGRATFVLISDLSQRNCENNYTHQHGHGASLAQFWRGVAHVGGASDPIPCWPLHSVAKYL